MGSEERLIEKKEMYVCHNCKKKYPDSWNTGYIKATTDLAIKSRKCEICGRYYVHPSLMRIIGPYILIQPLLKDAKTKHGVIMPQTVWRLWRIGEVAQLGERKIYTYERHEPGKKPKMKSYLRPDVKLGDTILVLKNAIRNVRLGVSNLYFVHYDDCECTLTDPETFMPI